MHISGRSNFLLNLCAVFINFDCCVHGGFPASPVLIHAHCSRLNFAVLGVAMLKDGPWQFYVWGVFKKFCQKISEVCLGMVRAAL